MHEAVMRTHTTILAAIAAFAFGGIVSAFALLPVPLVGITSAPHPGWHEVRWPFPMDQWGKGTAYRCAAADCGTEITVYLRAKIGFCNCTAGLTDDADLDRISDAHLFGGTPYPQAPGQTVSVAWMKGRSRPFAVTSAQGDATIVSIGMHDNCDALVATALLPRGHLAVAEPVVMEFLSSTSVVEWAETTLGL